MVLPRLAPGTRRLLDVLRVRAPQGVDELLPSLTDPAPARHDVNHDLFIAVLLQEALLDCDRRVLPSREYSSNNDTDHASTQKDELRRRCEYCQHHEGEQQPDCTTSHISSEVMSGRLTLWQ